jgi:hypothetical protein
MSHLKLLKVLNALLSVNHALNLAEENIMLIFFSSTSSFYKNFLQPNYIFAYLTNKNSWKNRPISSFFRLDGQNCEDINFTHQIQHPIPKWRFMNFHKFFNWSDCFLWQKTITDKEKGKRRLLKCILIGRINRENSYS